jgi:hypothetical protein
VFSALQHLDAPTIQFLISEATPFAMAIVKNAGGRVSGRLLGSERERALGDVFKQAIALTLTDVEKSRGVRERQMCKEWIDRLSRDAQASSELVHGAVSARWLDFKLFRSVVSADDQFYGALQAEELESLLNCLTENVAKVMDEAAIEPNSPLFPLLSIGLQRDIQAGQPDPFDTSGVFGGTQWLTRQFVARQSPIPYAVERGRPSDALAAFASSTTRYAALIGPLGSGKTTFMAMQAMKYLSSGWAVLVTEGEHFSLPRLADELARDGMLLNHTPDWRSLLVRPWTCTPPDSPFGLIIFLDEIDPADVDTLAQDFLSLDHALDSEPASVVKVVVATDPRTWAALRLRVPVWREGPDSSDDYSAVKTIEVGEFTSTELDHVLVKLGANELTSSNRTDPPEPYFLTMRATLRNPIAIRFYADLLTKAAVPRDAATPDRLSAELANFSVRTAAEESGVQPSEIARILTALVGAPLATPSRQFAIPYADLRDNFTYSLDTPSGGEKVLDSLIRQQFFVMSPDNRFKTDRHVRFLLTGMEAYFLAISLRQEIERDGLEGERLQEAASRWLSDSMNRPALLGAVLSLVDQLADDPAEPLLIPILRACVESYLLRSRVAFNLTSPKLLGPLFEALRESQGRSDYLYVEAAEAIAATPTALNEVKRYLGDPDPRCQGMAVHLVGHYQVVQELDALLSRLSGDNLEAVKDSLNALVRLGEPAVLPLAQIVGDNNAAQRKRTLATDALRGIGRRTSDVSEALGQALKDGWRDGLADLTRSALLAGAVLHDPQLRAGAEACLKSDDSWTLIGAGKYFTEMPDEANTEEILFALDRLVAQESTDHFKTVAVKQLMQALAGTGDPVGIARILTLLGEVLINDETVHD